MGKILQSLVKSGLIISVQGVKGGYYLAQSMKKIKIYSVITAIEGPISLTDCIASGDSEICERAKNCLIQKSMEGIQAKLVKLLDEISLKDFEKTYSTSVNK
jgi:Rrf2 family protein